MLHKHSFFEVPLMALSLAVGIVLVWQGLANGRERTRNADEYVGGDPVNCFVQSPKACPCTTSTICPTRTCNKSGLFFYCPDKTADIRQDTPTYTTCAEVSMGKNKCDYTGPPVNCCSSRLCQMDPITCSKDPSTGIYMCTSDTTAPWVPYVTFGGPVLSGTCP